MLELVAFYFLIFGLPVLFINTYHLISIAQSLEEIAEHITKKEEEH